MINLSKLITINLNTINIGNLDTPTFNAITTKITSEEFVNESKLINIKIVLHESITKYDENIKKNILKLFKYSPKHISTMELITKLKVNYEDLVEILNEIKKSYINKYLITFNESSNAFIDKITYNVLPSVTVLNKKNEEKLKLLMKCIIMKDIGKNEENNVDKKVQIRKQVFNNIKMMSFDRKEIKFDLNN